MVQGVAQVQVFGVAEVRGARPARPAARWPRAASASTRSPTRIDQGERQPADRHALGPRPALHGARPPASCEDAGAFRDADRRLPQRRAGAPRGPRRRSSTACRTTRPPPGSRATASRGIILAVQRQPGTNTVAVADAVRSADRAPARRSCRPRSSSTSSTTAPSRSAQSVSDVQFTLLLTLSPGGAGDLPLPAQPLGHGHPQPGAADVAWSAPSR